MKKRRFAEGGFSDIDEGRDTPDQALARKASMSSLASSDKAAGLASTKGQNVGFFKRLSMGNIDAPGSEASNSFGAGKGSSDRMAQAANQDSPARPEQRPTPVAPVTAPRPIPVVSKPMLPVDLGEIKDEAGTVSRFRRNTETGEAYDPGSATESRRTTPLAKPKLKRRPVKPDYEAALKSVAKGKATPNPRDAELGVSRGMRKNPLDEQPLKKGGSIKAYAKGGSVSASRRGDGCAQRGKTRGMMR